MFLLDDILLSPVKLTIWLAEKTKEELDRQMFDVPTIKHALERLQELHEIGQISDEDFKKVEDKLLKNLQQARELEKAKKEKQ